MPSQKILIFIEDAYEDMELVYPKYRLQEAGYVPVIAGPIANQKYSGKHGYPTISDVSYNDLSAANFAGVILVGGWMPDKLRRDPKVLALTRDIANANKLTAAICHGGWLAISAGVYKNVNVTGSPGIKDDLMNAGATFHDAPVIIDRHFVSSRRPDDLPQFMQACLKILSSD